MIFETPVMDVQKFAIEDVIATSTGNNLYSGETEED